MNNKATDIRQKRYKSNIGKKYKQNDIIKKSSTKRQDSKCSISNICGGCQYIDMPYDKQLELKQKRMEELLSPFGYVEKIIGMDNPYYYRNKINVSFKKLKNGTVIAGRYEEGTHNVFAAEACYIEDKRAASIIKSVAELMKSFKMQIYNEDTGTGLIRHMQIRTGHQTGQIMVIIVTASPVFPSKNNFSKALLKLHPEITTIIQNINNKNNSMVLGDRNQVMYGKGYIEDMLCGKCFRISPGSFYQVNPVQTEVLYKKAIKYADIKKKETVIDAYCGIGTIGMIAADNAKQIIGVELNRAAIKDANINCRINKLTNVSLYNNDAGQFMVELAEQNKKIDVVFMDPPRSGSDEAFLSSLIKLAPKRVVYISCGPESLARDLKYLTKNGYKVIIIQPVDLFPMVEHVETVVLLYHQEVNNYVHVDFEPENADYLKRFKGSATYAEIKAWVLEHYGFQVSSLYVAQVKRKCGLEVGENYNKAKSDDNKVPVCPKEKEDAIMEAFRYFRMI